MPDETVTKKQAVKGTCPDCGKVFELEAQAEPADPRRQDVRLLTELLEIFRSRDEARAALEHFAHPTLTDDDLIRQAESQTDPVYKAMAQKALRLIMDARRALGIGGKE